MTRFKMFQRSGYGRFYYFIIDTKMTRNTVRPNKIKALRVLKCTDFFEAINTLSKLNNYVNEFEILIYYYNKFK